VEKLIDYLTDKIWRNQPQKAQPRLHTGNSTGFKKKKKKKKKKTKPEPSATFVPSIPSLELQF